MNCEELLQIINTLNNIQVPTILIESVTIPIRNCAIKLEKIYQEEMTKKEESPKGEILQDGDIEVFVGDKPPEV